VTRAHRCAVCVAAAGLLLAAALVVAVGTGDRPARPGPTTTPGTWTATAVPIPQVVTQ
jgi:hypothetical protein